ncbi:MAG: hypothetical protein ACP6IS_10585 [Candidatus Asgardarchaeia archaeon]
MCPKKKKKSSKKGKLILFLLIIAIAGFSVWTYPTTQVQSFNTTSILGTQTYSFNVKKFHNVLILHITYKGTGGAISISLISPNNIYVYNYTKYAFDGTYTLEHKITNATEGVWIVKITLGLGNVSGNITITTMGLPWYYIFK